MKLRTLLSTCLLLGSVIAPPLTSAAEPVLRFAILGDAEPKPKAEFPGLAAAVGHVNHLTDTHDLDFVIGVGDIAHKGTELQYEAVTPVLQRLTLPFYPIMGNEEHSSTVERYMEYAQRWNEGKVEIPGPSYVMEFEQLALVMASPDEGRDFHDEGVAWVKQQVQQLHPKPVLLVVHGAPAGTFPENPDKGIHHPGFADVSTQPNLVAMISGDLHMDLERSEHSKQIDGVHHLHIPALERTKIPDEDQHVPMFRVLTVMDDNQVIVDTYQVGIVEPLARHDYRFSLDREAQ
ncbi:Calcineurin-like phosphoesterase [Halopseudomonas litoralis]|uniref:Calcineurin-like phosphoesterase n=1 Tax=Halopseudomonas litoralis TaxID=797277 RepID=A0A1H1XG83_9GAMM|nr:metallophosphoesterase [Halopseudomonas litoralis]SDT08267.1 Calcineurin-like phosphoesterase [Halopseudomonas litoralis]